MSPNKIKEEFCLVELGAMAPSLKGAIKISMFFFKNRLIRVLMDLMARLRMPSFG